MTILLTIGSKNSGAPDVFGLLREAGMAAPSNSMGDIPSPETLQSEVLRGLGIDPDRPDSLEQVDAGGRWQQKAASQLQSNHGVPLWGWCTSSTLLFMDFWLAADPATKILMVYADPAEELVLSFAERAGSAAGSSPVLQDWHRWNDALLRYHFRHSDRTLLVNSRSAMEHPDKLLGLLATSLGIKGLQVPPSRSPASLPSGSLLLNAAQVAVSVNDDVRALHQELHDAAPLNGSTDPQSPADASALWDAACVFVENAEQGMAQLREELGQGREAVRRLQSERDEQEHLANERYLEIARLTEQLGQIDSLRSQLESALEDKELVGLQLQQVQEELAHYFKAWQDERTRQGAEMTPAVEALNHFWRTQQPDVLALDLRRPIAGTHWYDAEADGRWSGPAAESSLQLPGVQPGQYLLELDVMDAMDSTVVDETQVEIQGQLHPLKVEYFGGEGRTPALCSARVQISDTGDDPLVLKLHLPMTISPSAHGSEDSRQLGLRLQQVRLIRGASA